MDFLHYYMYNLNQLTLCQGNFMAILCNLQNINLSFGQKHIFQDARFAISEGDKIGLIGLNGHGKSTLLNILSEKVIPDISTPPFIFDKNNEKWSLFYVPQELEIKKYGHLEIKNFYLAFYPDLYELNQRLSTIQKELEDDYTNEALLNKQQDILDSLEQKGAWDIENAYLSYLSLFELDQNERPLESLSGGEQKKIALSVGLSSKANLILWDEPTNHLDVETIEKFEDEIVKGQGTYLIISHDRYLLNHVTNKILHIEAGEIKSYTGTYLEYLEYLEEREKELAKNLDKLENKHRRELAWMRQGIKARGTRSKKRVEGYENIKKDISDLKARSRKTANFNLTHSGRKSKELVQLKEVSFEYNDKKIFEDLTITVFKGDKIALIGPNGAGKTTLLKILAGKLTPTNGIYKALDQLNVITFDQKRESLDLDKTLFEVVGDGQEFVHLGDGRSQHVMSYLENFLFNRDQIHRPIHTLSGGEKNRLQLAMFMRHSADVWIFDEPTNDLDIETIEILERELANYKAAVIIVGHDRAFLDNVCEKTWLVHENNIEVFEGGYTQVAPYLHALEMEKALIEKNKSDSPKQEVVTEAPKEATKKEKMSYNEKKRWDVIEEEIANTESEIEELQSKMASFDFSSGNPEDNAKYESLNQTFTAKETQLESLMLEWEELSEKEY